jgi:hypothetical protein
MKDKRRNLFPHFPIDRMGYEIIAIWEMESHSHQDGYEPCKDISPEADFQ